MQELVTVTGIILNQAPVGEYDRRVCILTSERGKISAFARGARKPNSRLVAATSPFSFGQFRLYEGRSSYNIMDASISNYFETLRGDYIGACYGMYFLEIADYYTRENNDEKEMMKLLYQSLRALTHPPIPDALVKCIYEIKAVAVNGEFPGIPGERAWNDSTVYAVDFILSTAVERLYTFGVTDKVLEELQQIGAWCRQQFMGKTFRSLEVLETLAGAKQE